MINHKKGKRYVAGILCVLIVLLSSCSQEIQTESADILTQKKIDGDKIPITVMVKYAFSINSFEKAVEEKFPQIDIVQVGNYTGDMGKVEYERRLAHDDLTDIVMTWPLDIGQEYWKDRLIDLSSMSFTSKYNTSMLNNIAKDGELYYLPGPAQVRGIVYNKTLFKENGWQVPTNFEEFVSLCKQIEDKGIRSIQLGFKNSEVLDTAFVGYGYGACFSKPQDSQWLLDYNQGTGSFGEQFMPALDTFQRMIDEGIWKKEDLNISYSDREQMLFTRQCAMAEDSVLMARMGYAYNGCTDEFALMPFFNPEEPSDWARLYMVCYIGLNKHLLEPENKQKYELVQDLMEYISTPEGQATLAADTGAMYSSLKEVPPPDIPEIESLAVTLAEGRYAIFPELKNAQDALRKGLAGMVSGTSTKLDVINMVNAQNKAPKTTDKETVIGTASSDFTLIETGNFITDAMRKKAGTDIALFLDNGKDGRYNGKGLSARLYEGDQTENDVVRILPDLKQGEKGVLQVVTMTGEDLINTLEYSIPVNNNEEGWFYYFSGLKMEYDPVASPGERIGKITDADGNEIDMKKTYSIAVMDETVPEKYIKSLTDSKTLMTDLLVEEIARQKTISPSEDGRFKVL